VPLTPLDIRQKTFANQLRGVNAQEVTSFLDLVAKEMEQLRKDRAELAERVEELQARVEQYQRTENLLRDTMVTAQRNAAETKANADKEAAVILQKAGQDADQVRHRAREETAALRRDLERLETERLGLLRQIRAIAASYVAMTEKWETGPAGRTDVAAPAD
jgi:DivIVA domain-containing protein